MCLSHDLTQGGEIVVVKNGARRTSTASARGTATGSATGSTVATGSTTTATAATTLATTVTAETTTAALTRGLLPGTVPLNNGFLTLLLLGLLVLLDGSGVVAEVLLLDGDQRFLLLGALVGLAQLLGGVEASISTVNLQLGHVLVESKLLDLGLLRLGLGILSLGGLLLGLSNSLTGLLILQLGLAVSCAPGLGSLLLGTTDDGVSWICLITEAQMIELTYGAMFLACLSSALR